MAIRKEKTAGVRAMTHTLEIAHPLLPWPERLRRIPEFVDGPPIGAHHRGKVEHSLHASFDLEGANPKGHESAQVFEETEILGIEDVGPVRVFADREELTRAFFLNEPVGPAARLRAKSLVGAALVQKGAQKTPARIGHTHGAVNEHLQFDGRGGRDTFNLRKSEFAGKVDAAHAERLPETCAEGVRCVALGAEMYGDEGTAFPGKGQDSGVAYDDSVNVNVLEVPEEGRERIKVRFPCKRVDGHIESSPESMTEADSLGQVFIAEIASVGSQAVFVCSDVHGVCAVEKRYFALFKASRRGEQFGLAPLSPELERRFEHVLVSSRNGNGVASLH